GVFAINFASHAEIRLDFERNTIGGPLEATGGVSRPDAVTGARICIQSERNLYRNDSGLPIFGWSFIGGADAPIPIPLPSTTFNSLRIHSRDDAIEGFATGISAIGGRRFGTLSGATSSNRADLRILGLQLDNTDADLELYGARSYVAGLSP